MAVTIIIGANGRVEVGAAAANLVVEGVSSVDMPNSWKTKELKFLGDTATRTIMIERAWSVTLNMAKDSADSAGQVAIRTAYANGSNLAIKIWEDYTNATTHFYTCLYGKVPDLGVKVDPNNEVSNTCTIKSDGTEMTLPV
jgi:hypothetical protein